MNKEEAMARYAVLEEDVRQEYEEVQAKHLKQRELFREESMKYARQKIAERMEDMGKSGNVSIDLSEDLDENQMETLIDEIQQSACISVSSTTTNRIVLSLE